MKSLIKIAIIIIVTIIIVTSIYVAFYIDWEDNEKDEEPPTIDSITKDTTGKSGERVKISVSFSDNVEVTEATIYYRVAGGSWQSDDILSGSFYIDLPPDSTKKWYYYVTIDDEAGNGPVGDPSTDGSDYYTITVTDDNGNGNGNGNGNNNGTNGYARTVFIEESTSTICQYCPNAAKILHKLFNPDDPDFYYISLVDDENNKAKDRVENHYNRFANPTLYIDGGYEVMLGINPKKEDEYEANLKQNIKNAANREVPELVMNLNARYNETRTELSVTVDIENKESAVYTGNLKVFIAEIQSRWIDYNNEPFHYAFIDYAIDKAITIQAGENLTYSNIWNANKAGFSDIYPENIMVYAVVFNSEKNQRYSFPKEEEPDENPFDAYFADAVVATKIKEGTLPPTIGIIYPTPGHRYIFGRIDMKNRLTKRTVFIGRGSVEVVVEAEAGIDRVEFFIDGKLKYNTTKEPFRWNFSKIGTYRRFILKNKHTISVTVYDKEGKTATDSMKVVTFFL